MVEHLFIRLAEPGGEAAWAAFDAAGQLVSAVGRGPLAGARAAAEGRRVVLLVPGIEVITTQADLPAAGAARMRQMLPFSLEDTLAEDVEQLSFAVGARLQSGALAVAVVAKQRMDAWLAALRDAGLTPHAIYAETEGVADVPATLTLLIENDTIYGRRADRAPFAFEGLGLRRILDLARADGAPADELKHVLVYADRAGRARYEAELAALGDEFGSADVKLVVDGLFPRMAATLAQRPGTNLLQGQYAPRSNLVALAKPWRAAASLLVALGLLGLALQGIHYWSLSRDDGALAELVAANCERVVAARRLSACQAEVQQRQRAAGGQASSESFLTTLAAIAASRGPATRIDTLNYREAVMDLQLVVADVPALDQFAHKLEETRRFKTVIESTSQNDSGVEGRIQIVAVGR